VLLVPNPIRHQITGGYQGVISVQKNPQDFFFLQKNLRTGQITFCETAGPFCPLFPEKLPINSSRVFEGTQPQTSPEVL
jgi:hypothetical protein